MPSPDFADRLNFARALASRSAALPPGIQGRGASAPLKRFSVYRNNVFASLTAALTARFPVVERLVGPDFFRAMAGVFIERSPPRSPVLLDYGGDLPRFLESFDQVRELPYLPDVARLEWAINTAYHAADVEPIQPLRLAALMPDEICEGRLILHPSVSLVSSPFPIVTIWQTNTHDKLVRPVRPGRSGEDALISRRGFDVAVAGLTPPGVMCFATALRDGMTIERAVSRAIAEVPEFDLRCALALLLRAGALAGIQLSRASSLTQPHPAIGA